MALGSTRPLTEISTRNLPGGESGRRIGLTTLPPCMSRMSENVRASTSRNPKGLHGLYRDSFIFINNFAENIHYEKNEMSFVLLRFISEKVTQ
jgi:hypothetical protein